MKINVLGLKNKKEVFIKSEYLNNNYKYYLNGNEIHWEILRDRFIISIEDKFQYLGRDEILVDYRKGNIIMSKEEYNSKPTYYDDEKSDEYVLRCIANKKELEGFVANYQEPILQDVELNIVGYIEDTKSKFISCTISGKWEFKELVVYTTYGSLIAMDEYNKLSKKYENHAIFEKPDRSYLRFVKINNNFAFDDMFPFSDREFIKNFTTLDQATKEEENIRDTVKKYIDKQVFKENLTLIKSTAVLSQLKMIQKIKNKKNMDESINILIKDLTDYVSLIK